MGPPACAAREKGSGRPPRVGFWERFRAPHMRRSDWWMNWDPIDSGSFTLFLDAVLDPGSTFSQGL